MPAGVPPFGEDDGGRDLAAELAAERAAADSWRHVARDRAAKLAALERRPGVRAVLAAERRLRPARQSVRALGARLRPLVERTTLALVATGRHRGRDHAQLELLVAALPAPPPDARGVTVVLLGDGEPPGPPRGCDRALELVRLPLDASVAAVDRALRRGGHPLAAVVLATSEPLDAGWLDRLSAAVSGAVVAATPLLVHPLRAGPRATPHDGRVRAAGIDLAESAAGVPCPRADRAGTVPDPTEPPFETDAASAACFVVDRARYAEAGGLPHAGDLDIAVVELCARLREQGGRIVVVPGATMVDHRPVRSWAELRGPADPGGTAWAGALARSGPVLLRSVRPLPAGKLRFALTVAAPSAKVAPRWGDWHLADGMAGALRRGGHEVRLQTLDHADDPATRTADVHVVLRGLAPVPRTGRHRHVLWIISHPESVEDEELHAADLVLVASPRFAAHLRTRTATPVAVLLQATDPERFTPRPVDPARRHPVVVVAKTRDVLRPAVADAIAVGIRPAIYGSGWREFVDPELVVADHLDNREVAAVYSSAGVVLNDHWRTMANWGFVSNRLFDVLACGAPVISDPVEGITDLFAGAVLVYHSRPELRALVDDVLGDPQAARAGRPRPRRCAGRAHV